ncbi:MAG: TIGR03067 domain-containing protein, partial [Planctomycetes bacterium]|nr:TIGR03067 domain-containing protein [Planctomycetota bacterium]
NPRQRRMKIEVTIKGDTIMAVQDGSKSLGEGTFVAQVAKGGKNMNATRTNNPGKGQTYNGIYSLDGDTLKWCVSSPPGRERPTELVSKTGQFLMVLTREKK